jgi:hypothetical protein
MARSRRIPLRETLRKLFPTAVVAALARASGAVQRLRKVSPTPSLNQPRERLHFLIG